MIKIKTALISVSDKSGIVQFARILADNGTKLISTGGTAKALQAEGLQVYDISEITGFPEIMDGRVKTLHPKVHGGLLAVRNNPEHFQAMQLHGIGEIDMVVVNLYPFEAAVARGAEFEEVIENIDIGGPSMIRSGAKNHAHVVVVTDPADYAVLENELKKTGGISKASSRLLAAKAFARTTAYDGAIANWFSGAANGVKFGESINISGRLKQNLRYGENPHQQAAFYVLDDKIPGVATAQQIQGKELSYNNINDTDAAFQIVAEFTEPTIAIIKHANPCGVASGKNVLEAYNKAYNADKVSAFGGIIAANVEIDAATAEEIGKLFAEVVIAPKISDDAKKVLAGKKNLRVLVTKKMPEQNLGLAYKSVAGGLLVQDIDNATISEEELTIVSKRKPTKVEIKDLIFAFKVAKHVKSNAIVTAQNQATTGIGAGQMSRVASVQIAVKGGGGAGITGLKDASPVAGSVLASDAFFPFADGIEAAAKAGITAIIHPGGSMRDEEVFKGGG